MTPEQVMPAVQAWRPLAVRLAGQDADDLMQDVAERALRNCGREITPGWFCMTMKRRAIDGYRRPSTAALDDAPEPAAADSSDARAILVEALRIVGTLPLPNQEALTAAMLWGQKEAARRLGLPLGTYMGRLQAARQALREALDGGVPKAGVRASWTKRMTRTRWAGARARAAGVARSANPYRQCDHRRAWDAGWVGA